MTAGTNSKNDSVGSLINDSIYWDSFTILNYEKFSYPNSALVGVSVNARYFSQVPERTYHVRGRLIRVPMNYDREFLTGNLGTLTLDLIAKIGLQNYLQNQVEAGS